ncbi:unnamed protein product, partial [Nesidiocoris tenuis]
VCLAEGEDRPMKNNNLQLSIRGELSNLFLFRTTRMSGSTCPPTCARRWSESANSHERLHRLFKVEIRK